MRGKVRKAEFAGLYYPSDQEELNGQIEIKLSDNGILGPDLSAVGVSGLIIPSAGFSFASKVALAAYQKIIGRKYSKVIILGQSHFFSFNGIALTQVAAYESPLGQVNLDALTVDLLATNFNFHFHENAFAKEYSLEVQLPYLQKLLSDFQIIPMLIGGKINLTEAANAIANIIDDQTLLVVSTNLSHFLTDEKARKEDQETINAILAKDGRTVLNDGQASALSGIALLNEIAILKDWQPMFMAYGNSAESGDDIDSVIGYASLIYLSS